MDSVIFTKFSRGTCFSANGMVYYKSSMRSFLDAIPTVWRRIEVVVTSLTRNQVVRKGTWVRIPPSPPRRSKRYIVCSDVFLCLWQKRRHLSALLCQRFQKSGGLIVHLTTQLLFWREIPFDTGMSSSYFTRKDYGVNRNRR